MPEPSANEVLLTAERVLARFEAYQATQTAELKSLHQELQTYALASERRFTTLEVDRERWSRDTWPAATQVLEALRERTQALERSSLTVSALRGINDRIDRRETLDREEREALKVRVAFLEGWRMKMVGLAAGVGLATSLISALVIHLIKVAAASQ